MPKKRSKKKLAPEPEPEIEEDETIVVIPEDQDQLDESQLEEEHTMIIRASDPNAPDNLQDYNFAEQVFKPRPSDPKNDPAVHFDRSYSLIAHLESEDAKMQMAMEAQIVEREKEVLAELEEAAKQDENRADGEEIEDAAALRNQFNFSERAMQTNNPSRKHAEVMTVPPTSIDFSATASQWEIWDWYSQDLASKEKEANRSKEKAKSRKPAKDEGRKTVQAQSAKKKDPMYTPEMARSLRVVERAVNQNAFDDILQDFKFWEDESDKLKPESGSLLPLWQFSSQKTRHRMVTGICWNGSHHDLFAVSFGSYDFTRQSTGVICCYSLKNPSAPDFVYQVESGVMCVDFNISKSTSMLACGLYDGSIMVYDLGRMDQKTAGYDREPVVQSTIRTGKHMDPVWQVRWSREDSSGVVSFLSISTDGRLMNWALTTNELQVETLMQFKLLLNDESDVDEAAVVGQASTTCFAFSKDSSSLFVVGSEEGDIYKCSTAYATEYLMSYEGHDLNVYSVEYNHYHPNVFLSASADWTVKLWDHSRPRAVMSWDLNNAVCDVAWAPFSSTVFAAVTSDAQVHVFDLAINKIEPMCKQKVVRKAKLTKVVFNPVEPILLVGDDKGQVVALKLSPNLRKLTEVPSHKHPKTGEKLPPPTDPDDLKKWQAEELEAEVEKLSTIMGRVIQQQQTGPGGEDNPF